MGTLNLIPPKLKYQENPPAAPPTHLYFSQVLRMSYSPTASQAFLLLVMFIAIAHHLWRRLRATPSAEKINLTTFHEIRALLAPPGPLPALLAQRAAPNARLIRAFGITNTFVSPEASVHAAFTRDARSLVRAAHDWDRFAECAHAAVERCLSAHSAEPVPYAVFVQNVALHAVLEALFRVPQEDIDVPDLGTVARGINDLWRLSKTTEDIPPSLLRDVNACLRRWIPTHDNPVDFIVPAFETMWRVVAITLAYTHADPLASEAYNSLLTSPSANQFEAFDGETPSVEALVTEALRLHPPTKRISRQTAEHLHITVADVGTLHRDPKIWGPDADVYIPFRHHPARRTLEQKQALLGFGFGRVKCVASGWAPQAAGTIIAAIASRVEVVEGKGIGGREGWEGWYVRRQI